MMDISERPVRIGFVELTDCVPVVLAQTLGLFQERGITAEVVRMPSWTAIRDGLLGGELDAAHCLFSMPLSVATGIGHARSSDVLRVAMGLSSNGQAITLKRTLAPAGYGDLDRAREVIAEQGARTFAMTFPGGTHDVWLRYWLDAAGVDVAQRKVIPIPPPQMVANMVAGNVDGFCVGEPWNAVAARKGIGFTAITSQDIWERHPEKALVVNARFAHARRDDLKRVMGALIDACSYADDASNIPDVAHAIGSPGRVHVAPEDVEGRLIGEYDLGLGLGDVTFGHRRMRFFRGGDVTMPRRGAAIWFLAQYARLGYLDRAPDYERLSRDLVLSDLYAEVAAEEGLELPDDGMRPFELKLDGSTFDPFEPDRARVRA